MIWQYLVILVRWTQAGILPESKSTNTGLLLCWEME
jgi:hypothetical protein